MTVLALASACESERTIGSVCSNNSCAQTVADAGDQSVECVVSTLNLEIAMDIADEPPLCLPARLLRSAEGVVACRMLWELAGTGAGCEDFPFAEQAPDAADTCVIEQLVVRVENEGTQQPTHKELADSEAAGWFYDDFSHLNQGCSEGNGQRISLTDGVQPPAGARMRLSCVRAWADPAVAAPALALGDLPVEIDPRFCAGLDDAQLDGVVPSDLGASCEPSFVDRALYVEEESYVHSGASACSSGVCLIYHWADPAIAGGAPDGDGGVMEVDFEARAQCSCRCDSMGSGAPECQCGDGFACVDVVSGEAPAAVAGGYCVRTGPTLD